MPNAFSNAIATLTIQDQDLVQPGLANLVNRATASVTFPAPNGVIYSGYQTLTTGSVTLFSSGVACPFLYFRNISVGQNNTAQLNFVLTGSIVTNVLNLAPGGIFLFANPVVSSGPSSQATNLSSFLFGPYSSSQITVEYMYAF